MSASPVPILPSEPYPTGIKGKFLRTRESDLAVLRSFRSEIAARCLMLIAVESIGWGKGWTRQPITGKQFAKYCNGATEEACQNALGFLQDEGLIEARRSTISRGLEYRRKQPIYYEGKQALGQCPDCKKTSQFTIDRDVTIPQSLFLNLQGAVDHGAFLCVLLISLETFRWQQGEIWIYPKEIKVEEFIRRTGRHRAEVLADLARAEAHGLIGSSGKRGSIQTFWPIPNAWPAAGLRMPRTGGNPTPKQRNKSEPKTIKTPQPVEPKTETSPVEFLSRPCGKCHECGYWGPVDIVTDADKAPRKPAERARAGPLGGNGVKKPKFIQDLERRKAEAIADGLRRLG